MNVSFYLPFEVTVILSLRLPDQYNGCRVIVVKPKKLIGHVQLVTTCEPSHMSKICLQDRILQI